ncbi:hypothetical protein [Microbulbifer donghaiensis]|uniref:hypothetical protein n=1 Tax=Microbulbifer donghaiensis TaxID=494016 RepID=UPI000A82229D|nr:hypothetical protein [Microbulbifer donghaiensis]
MHTQLDTIPSLKGKVSDAEWQLRVDLAAAYRLVAHYGWTTLFLPTCLCAFPALSTTS